MCHHAQPILTVPGVSGSSLVALTFLGALLGLGGMLTSLVVEPESHPLDLLWVLTFLVLVSSLGHTLWWDLGDCGNGL